MPLSAVSSAPSPRTFATGGGPLGPEEEVEEVLGEVLGPSPARSAVSSAVGAARTPLELLLLKIGDFLRPSPSRSTRTLATAPSTEWHATSLLLHSLTNAAESGICVASDL